MAGRVGWPRGKIIRDVIRNNFSDTLNYRTKIGKCNEQGSQLPPALGANFMGSQSARHASTEVGQEAVGVNSGSNVLKTQGIFKNLGEDLNNRHLKGIREFSTKNRVKRLTTKSAKQRPESKSSLRKIEKGKSSHSVTTDLAGKFKKIHRKTAAYIAERRSDVQRNTMSHFNASSGNTAAGSGGQGYGTTGMSSGHYAPLNSTKSLQSNGTIANRMGAFGTHNQPPKEQVKQQSEPKVKQQTAGARMQELRQIQRHHDPVRLMGKNLEAEYIPKPVTKYRSHGKGILGNLDNPVVAPISTFTKPKKGHQHIGGGVIQPGPNSRFDSRNKLLRDSGRLKSLSKKQRSNPQLGHLPFDPHDVVNRSIKYPIPEEAIRPNRNKTKTPTHFRSKKFSANKDVPLLSKKTQAVQRDEVIRRTNRRPNTPKPNRHLRRKESAGRQDYSELLPTADKENVRQQLAQRQLNKTLNDSIKIKSTTMNANVNSTTGGKRSKQQVSDRHAHETFVGNSKLYKGYTRTSATKMQTKVPDYGQSKRSISLDEWANPQYGSKNQQKSQNTSSSQKNQEQQQFVPSSSDPLRGVLPKVPATPTTHTVMTGGLKSLSSAGNTLGLRSSTGETSFGLNNSPAVKISTIKPKRANLKSKRASQTQHLQQSTMQASRSNSGANMGPFRPAQITNSLNVTQKEVPIPVSATIPKKQQLVPKQSLQQQPYVQIQNIQQPKSLFRTVDTTYLKMTSPKPPEKKPWAQPETFVSLDIPKPKQNWDNRRLRELATIKRTAATNAWAMSKTRALSRNKQAQKSSSTISEMSNKANNVSSTQNPQNQKNNQSMNNALLNVSYAQAPVASIVKKLKVREPVDKNSSLGYNNDDKADSQSETEAETNQASILEEPNIFVGKNQQLSQSIHAPPQRSGLNIDGLATYRTRAPYPSFAESFKMMPKSTSSGIATAHMAHKRHHHHHHNQHQNQQQKDNHRTIQKDKQP